VPYARYSGHVKTTGTSSLLEPSRPTSTDLNKDAGEEFAGRKSSVQVKSGSFAGSYNPPEALTFNHNRIESEGSIFQPPVGSAKYGQKT